MDDKADGEEIEIELGMATALGLSEAATGQDERGFWRDHTATLTNSRNQAVQVELAIPVPEEQRLIRPSHPLARKNGQPLWRVTIPAHGSARLAFRLEQAG
jgi:hypothetical protein